MKLFSKFNSLSKNKPIVADSNLSIVEPLIGLLKSLHIEVQYEAIELITLLMDYSVKDVILKSLVTVLKPAKKIEKIEPIESKDKDENSNIVAYIQQAAAAKSIGILTKLSNQISEQFLSVKFKFEICRETKLIISIYFVSFKLFIVCCLRWVMKNMPIVRDKRLNL